MRHRIGLVSVLFFIMLNTTGCASRTVTTTQEPVLDSSLGEEIILIPLHLSGGDVMLETTVFHPRSKGPHPLVIFNHGANGKLPSFHQQPRERPIELVKFFLARGYFVAVPMREGFDKSTGNCFFSCNHAEYALTYSRDIRAVEGFFISQKEANADQVVVIGQSNGGMVALGYATGNPIAKGIINISGGINTERPGCDWQRGMVSAAGVLGAQTKIPSLWMYAQDDLIFPPSVSKPFFESYKKAVQT